MPTSPVKNVALCADISINTLNPFIVLSSSFVNKCFRGSSMLINVKVRVPNRKSSEWFVSFTRFQVLRVLFLGKSHDCPSGRTIYSPGHKWLTPAHSLPERCRKEIKVSVMNTEHRKGFSVICLLFDKRLFILTCCEARQGQSKAGRTLVCFERWILSWLA